MAKSLGILAIIAALGLWNWEYYVAGKSSGEHVFQLVRRKQ